MTLDKKLVIPNTKKVDDYIRVSIEGFTGNVSFNVISNASDPK